MLKFEPISNGYRVYNGDLLIAVVTTKHHNGLYRDGVGIWEDLERKGWRIHFTSPEMCVDDVVALIAGLPATS